MVTSDLYCSFMMDTNDPYYKHVCVYEELFRESYSVIAIAQDVLKLSTKQCIESNDFWRQVLDVLNSHLSIANQMKIPQETLSKITHRIHMVQNLLENQQSHNHACTSDTALP